MKEYDIERLDTIQKIENWLRTDTSQTNKNRPKDLSMPFGLATTADGRDWVFFAASEVERQIWVHELSNLIK